MSIFTKFTLLLSFWFVLNPHLFSQPVYHSSVSNVGLNASVTIPKPAGTVEGNLLLVGLMIEKGSAETISPPSGWTLIRRTNNGTHIGMASYYKVAGPAEPSTYSFVLSNGSKWAFGCSRYSNVDPIAPIDNSSGSIGHNKNVIAPTVNSSQNNGLIVCLYDNDKKSTYTPAPTTSKRYDHPNESGGTPSNMMATFGQVLPGLTPNQLATSSENGRWVGMQIVLSPAAPLPIELVTFNAEITSPSSVLLNWVTASEKNNDYFCIERSKDGVSWECFDQVNGLGNSTQTQNYSCIDHHPFCGTSYYRLKQVDFDGQHTYSEIRSIHLNNCNLSLLDIYPNPSAQLIYATGNGVELSEINVFNAEGILVRQMQHKEGNQEVTLEIDLSTLPSGDYYIQTKNQSKKVIKL